MNTKLTFIGACHQVTGSCFLLQTDTTNILIDAGSIQGIDALETAALPIAPYDIDYIFLTHAHIDHSGNIPLLYKNGFKGQVWCTKGTYELSQIMLSDSAYIQMSDAAWINKHNKRSGKEEVKPPYDIDDVNGVLNHFYACDYNQWIKVTDMISIKFKDAGHLLGSSSILVNIGDKTLAFSGDIGNNDMPLIKNPSYLYDEDIDYVVMESTYGNKNHEKPSDYVTLLADIMNRVFARGGNLVIPSFAVGRAQELLYFIREIKKRKLVNNYFKVYLDSPLANEATEIYDKDALEYCNDETRALIQDGINPIIFKDLIRTTNIADSMAIQNDPNCKVIISAAGMCDAGRIRHHLKHNLWREECAIMFVGYQAVGTLGRIIIDGATTVKLFGEEVKVSAEIIQFPGISAHADQNGLLKWISALPNKPKKVFVVHGDDEVSKEFAFILNAEYGLSAIAPYSGTEFDIETNEFIYAAPPVENKKKNNNAIKHYSKEYEKLVYALERLNRVTQLYEEGANKDILKFATQINDLVDRWEY